MINETNKKSILEHSLSPTSKFPNHHHHHFDHSKKSLFHIIDNINNIDNEESLIIMNNKCHNEMSIDSNGEKSINHHHHHQNHDNQQQQKSSISDNKTLDLFNKQTKNELNESVSSSSSTISLTKHESQNDSLSNDNLITLDQLSSILKNDNHTKQFQTIITTQSDHSYSTKSKTKTIKNHQSSTTKTRKRKQKKEIINDDQDNCLKNIILNNNTSEKITIVPIKVDLHHDSTKILFLNELDSNHCISLDNKQQQQLLLQSSKMARENHPVNAANHMATILNNNNNNNNCKSSSNSNEQKNITFVQHYQQQQQQLQHPQTSSFGQGNSYNSMNNNNNNIHQFISIGNNGDVIYQQQMSEINNNNTNNANSNNQINDAVFSFDDLNSPSSFIASNNHSLPPVQTILNNNSSSNNSGGGGGYNNQQNYQSTIQDFNTEMFNSSLDNGMNFNSYERDPFLEDIDLPNEKYLLYGCFTSDEDNCNQQISPLLPSSLSPSSPSLNTLNGHDLFSSDLNIMPNQSNVLSSSFYDQSSFTSDPLMANDNCNKDGQIILPESSININELSNFGNNEYIELDSDFKNDSYFGSKKPKLMNGNSKHLQEMTLTQYNSLEISVDNHKNNYCYNGIWPNTDFELPPVNFNSNQHSKVLMASNDIATENRNRLKRPYPFGDDSVLFGSQKIQQQQQQPNLMMQSTNDTSSINDKGSFVIQDNTINQPLPQPQYSSPNLKGQQSHNNIAPLNENRQTINMINHSQINGPIVQNNLVANNLVSLYQNNNNNINNQNATSRNSNGIHLFQNISQPNTSITFPSTTTTTIPSFPNRTVWSGSNSKSKESCHTQMITGSSNINNNNDGSIVATMINSTNNRIRNDSVSTDISDEGFASHSENDSDDNSDNNSEMLNTINEHNNNDHRLSMVDTNIDIDQNRMNNIVNVDCKKEEGIYDVNGIIQIESKEICENNVWINDENDLHSKASNSSVQAKNSLSIDENDYSEDDDDDDESFFGDYNNSDLLNATISDDVNNKWSLRMGRSRKGHDKRYFWQYNVQSKGPKGPRQHRPLDDNEDDDPHVLKETTDPVFAPDCQIEGVKHSGKARKGDGNDLTANPTKLLKIGLELKKLGKILNGLTPVTEVPANFRNKSRKEKNKLASRACRLKKKAQHEANKIKLHGLHREHGRLNKKIKHIRHLIEMALRFKEIGQPQICNFSGQFQCRITSISDIPFILQKIKANNQIDMEIAGKTADFVNQILDNVTQGITDGGLDNY
ncbi:hypothetical protein DERP_010171 [Dermatophagoides pteronyssinus]|uniref:BZIP domain-containing protein n=1 Tax=Dermatophagoides pteronyssinus TaxID=6956 RepID=A0ABQ8J6T8_DERPT|nr:hypothetical protein DERP_010171 [Dermatophagoides pteronyssinus]